MSTHKALDIAPQSNMTSDEPAIVSIDELQSHGVNASDIQKLRGAGVCSIAVSIHRHLQRLN